MNRIIEEILWWSAAIFLVLAFVFISSLGEGKTLHIQDKQTIKLDGEIRESTAFQFIDEVKTLAEKEKQINIIMHSPGGSIVFGMLMLKEIHRAQARNVKIVCIVDGFSMSMAFVLLSECDSRYAVRDSLLLWHPGRMRLMGVYTEGMLNVSAEQLKIFDEYINKMIRPKLKVSDRVYKYYGENDMLITVDRLKKLSPRFLIPIDDFRRIK